MSYIHRPIGLVADGRYGALSGGAALHRDSWRSVAAITLSAPAVMTLRDQIAQNIIQLITIQIHGITDPNSRDV
ncbi:hypothetical protein NOJ28_13915 [Neorhizobium galegae]|uniref:hypothetical protein n=1 Tax=Neorhizobium galegae TaxID=399 RepID=UPI000627FD6E|nr:hypothetical protein [Neorhizobium galegae]MCQ1766637.1 hypothetical protein [Neorhizobium galegae]MCQ1845737.1 hypothetical protein [Neorhizobium galegae]